MGLCCGITALVICIYIGYVISCSEKEKQEKNRREEENKRSRIQSYKRDFEYEENRCYEMVNSFYGFGNYQSYTMICLDLNQIINRLEEINGSIVKEDSSESLETRIEKLKIIVQYFESIRKKVSCVPDTVMIDVQEYGKIKKEYWDAVESQERRYVDEVVRQYKEALDNNQYDKILNIDLEKLRGCIWFYAIQKPYPADLFEQARQVFCKVYRGTVADIQIAEFYAIKQVSGEEILREKLKDLYNSGEKLMIYASAFMWMNAYQSENAVLQYMLSQGMKMSEKAQNRLHALSNGGSNAPEGFEVSSDDRELYFDVSALAWRDEEYTGFFENLAFQDKKLTYSLAIRDEDKDLFITQSGNSLDINRVLIKLREVFKEEYGDTVLAEVKNCIALSGSGEERIQGILSISKECKQMGVLVHIDQIGNKLNIKFYTLFMPDGNQLMEQKQQALSLYKKLSPSISMWESSLKDNILMVVQQLLNTTDSQKDINSLKDIDSPIF